MGMDRELRRAVAAARSLLWQWEGGQAAWLTRLAAPLSPALIEDGSTAARAVRALVGFDPLADLADHSTISEPPAAGGASAGGRAVRKRAALSTALPGAKARASATVVVAGRADERGTSAVDAAGRSPRSALSSALHREAADDRPAANLAPPSDGTRLPAKDRTTEALRSRPISAGMRAAGSGPSHEPDGSGAPAVFAGGPRTPADRLAALRRARTLERHAARLGISSASERRKPGIARAEARRLETRDEVESAPAAPEDPERMGSVVASRGEQASALAPVPYAAVAAEQRAAREQRVGAGRNGAPRREDGRRRGAETTRGSADGPLAVSELEVAVEAVRPVPSPPAVVEPAPEDSLALQLTESACRHGLDLT